MLKPVTDETFHEEVRETTDPVVVYFTGSWCQPCKQFGPVVEEMAKRFEGDVKFLKADMDEIEATASELNIRTLPSLVLFEGGMVRDVHSGTMNTQDFRHWVNENI